MASLLILSIFDINPFFYLKSVLMKRVYPLLFTVTLLTVNLPQIAKAQCTCTGGVPATPVDYYASFGPTNTSSTSVSFPQFNPSIGTLACLKLKDSISGTDVVEAEFGNAPPDWLDQLRGLAQAASVTQRDELVRISSHDGPATVAALMDLARSRKVTVRKVSVQSTTLDDVFLHYTGRELRDAAHGASSFDVSHLYR